MAEALPDLTTRILEAKLALHNLLTGSPMVSIQYGDRQVQYRSYATDIEKLQQYIAQLELEAGVGSPRRPMGVVW